MVVLWTSKPTNILDISKIHTIDILTNNYTRSWKQKSKLKKTVVELVLKSAWKLNNYFMWPSYPILYTTRCNKNK